MKLLNLFIAELSVSPWKLFGIAGLAGLSNALILAIINVAAEQASQSNVNIRYMAMFFIVIAIYIVAQRYIMITSTSEVEHIIHRLRVRIVNKICACDLSVLENLGHTQVYAGVTKETTTLSQSAPTLVIAIQSAVLVLFCVAYIAWLSVTAFILTAIVMMIGIGVHFKRIKQVNADIHTALEQENLLFDSLSDILKGFKEIKMNLARNTELHNHTINVSKHASETKAKAQTQIVVHFIFTQITFFLLLATIVFLLPTISDDYSDVVTKMTTAALFIIGPITGLVGSIPIFINANADTENILALEKTLRGIDTFHKSKSPDPQGAFKTLTLEQVTFHYASQKTDEVFSIGPIDLTINRGEIIFIVGGNGSGKSTLFMLLAGLHYPTNGSIRVNERLIDRSNSQKYRDQIAAVFSDFHLFKRLYGLPEISREQVQALLADFDLTGKTDLVDGIFTSLDLSSGQKKRIALIITLLEDRPIYLFDEWAADQDPRFRKRFYQEILPELRNHGKTVIAITHDDRYFDCADHLIHMEEGKIVKTTSGTSSYEHLK